MSGTHPRFEKDEFARLGDLIYERDLQTIIESENQGKFVAIDIESGAFEIDDQELAASDRLIARIPGAQIWLRRIGSRYARRIGPRPRTRTS